MASKSTPAPRARPVKSEHVNIVSSGPPKRRSPGRALSPAEYKSAQQIRAEELLAQLIPHRKQGE